MIPSNKDELISEIKEHFTTLRKDLEIFPAELANRKELEWQIKDTKVSVNNLISYLIWRWELVLKWERNFETPEKLLRNSSYQKSDLSGMNQGGSLKNFIKAMITLIFLLWKHCFEKQMRNFMRRLDIQNGLFEDSFSLTQVLLTRILDQESENISKILIQKNKKSDLLSSFFNNYDLT